MPQLGDVVSGRKIGVKSWNKYIWTTCEVCGCERWVKLANPQSQLKPISPKCVHCSRKKNVKSMNRGTMELSYTWKGGRWKDANGYIYVHIEPSDPYFPMAYQRNRNVLEHRLVMAKHLGRCLHSWEIVHHKNHIRDDNRIENLELVSIDEHDVITKLEEENKYLKKQIHFLLFYHAIKEVLDAKD